MRKLNIISRGTVAHKCSVACKLLTCHNKSVLLL